MSDRTVDEWTETLGDDIAYWMGNPFLDADLRASKVAYWLNKAASLPAERGMGGGCVVPGCAGAAGHNRGRADVPQNHAATPSLPGEQPGGEER